MEKIQELSFELHNKLKESQQYKNLKLHEKIINEDEISKNLISTYKKLHEKFTFDHSEKIKKELYKAKLEMDNNINIINYKKAYNEYLILVGKITDIVFEDYKKDNIIDKIIRAVK